jgi:hypothetical protein
MRFGLSLTGEEGSRKSFTASEPSEFSQLAMSARHGKRKAAPGEAGERAVRHGRYLISRIGTRARGLKHRLFLVGGGAEQSRSFRLVGGATLDYLECVPRRSHGYGYSKLCALLIIRCIYRISWSRFLRRCS